MRLTSRLRVQRSVADITPWARDLPTLANLLVRRRIGFCVIGGVALSCWVPEHIPDDLDIVVATGRWNSVKCVRVIDALLSATGEQHAIYPTPAGVREGQDLRIPTRLGVLDIVGSALPLGLDRDGIVARRRWWRIGSHRVPVCALPDLLAIKRETGREKDLRHIAALHAGAVQAPWTHGGDLSVTAEI